MRYYLGKWRMDASEEQARWVPPSAALARGALDLQSRTQAAAATDAGKGYGLFAFDLDPADPNLTFVTEDLDSGLPSRGTSGLASALGIAFTAEAKTLADCLWEAFTVAADPTGLAGIVPLVGARGVRAIRLSLNGVLRYQRLSTDPLDPSPEWANALSTLQAMYRNVRGRADAGVVAADAHRKLLWLWERKYERPFGDFVPADLPRDETPVPPTTTVSDDFTRSADETLETSANWTRVQGGISLQVNATSDELEQTHTSDNVARYIYQTALSSDDHFAQIDVLEQGQPNSFRTWWSALIRGDNTSADWLSFGSTKDSAGAVKRRVIKRVGGTDTTLVDLTETHALPDTYYIEMNGDDYTTKIDGVVKDGPTTETGLNVGNTFVGLGGYRGGGGAPWATMRADNWQGGDLAAAGHAGALVNGTRLRGKIHAGLVG